jgi:hypothetical protein
MLTNRPVCCGKPMHKHCTVMSGRNKRQQWQCGKCGRTTIINKMEVR